MPEPSVEFHPEAIAEAVAAREWYQVRSQVAADAFVAEINHAFQRITEDPSRWPKHFSGTRRYLLHKFPFSIVYREVDTVIQIVAIAHGRRRPRYWKER
jgi:toxin ParE1/3/4